MIHYNIFCPFNLLHMEISRNTFFMYMMTLLNCLQVHKSITDQCAAASCESSPSTSTDRKQLTTSIVLRHLSQQESTVECCICFERRPDMLLPCTHAYCQTCIEQWAVNHKTCPICREEAGKDEAWVMTEAPNSLEVSEDICSSLLELVSQQSSTDDSA